MFGSLGDILSSGLAHTFQVQALTVLQWQVYSAQAAALWTS